MAECPKPTQDIELNIKNRQKAIDKVGYGPLNPNEPNKDFWQDKADMWNVSIDEAKKQKCGNCAAFIRTEAMLECISKGLGDTKDSWDTIEAGQLGYCEALDFKCAASRTCDAWIDGNAKNSSGAKVSKEDIYFKTVQEILDAIELKVGRITEGSFVEWNSSGGKARGRVEHVMEKGTLGVPNSKFKIDAEPGNPAVLIRIWRKNSDGGWDETETLVGHKMSTLSRIESLSNKDARFGEMEEKATRRVRDADYWGRPVGTPITPGMKPSGPKSPAGRARAVSSGSSSSSTSRSTSKPSASSASKPSGSTSSTAGRAKPKKRVAVNKPGGSGSGGKKPPKKPTPAASGGDKPKKPSASERRRAAQERLEANKGKKFSSGEDAKKFFESDADADYAAAARQLEKEGWKWKEDPEVRGVYGLMNPDGSNKAAVVVYSSREDTWGMESPQFEADEELLDSVVSRMKKPSAKKPTKPKSSDSDSFDESFDRISDKYKLSPKEQNDVLSLDIIEDRAATDRTGKRVTVSNNDAIDRYEGARNHGYDHNQAMLYAEGVEGNEVERDARNDGPDSDFGKAVRQGKLKEWTESGGSEKEGDSRVGNDSDGGKKPKKQPLKRVRRPKKKRSDRNATINVSDAAKPKPGKKESKFNRDDETGIYDPAKAEDFNLESVAEELGKISKDGNKDATGTVEDPIDVGNDIELAHKLLAEGKHIRMDSHMELGSLIDKINEIVDDAKKRGDKAPDYDFCKVSVPGTNLFCAESKGIPRTKMPQFKGDPHEGSFAATKYDENKGESDIEDGFRDLLDKMGIKRELKKVPASDLKATQDNLVGSKVAGMMRAIKNGEMPQHVLDSPIFVTSDGYIVDGHHRWAALVALDMEDGVQGDIDIPVEVIDGDIGYILDIANGYADIGGIKRKGMEGGPGGKPTTGRSGKPVVLEGVGTVVQSENTQGKKSDVLDCEPCKGHVY